MAFMVQIHCSVKDYINSLTLPGSANQMSQFNNHCRFSHLGLLKVIGLYGSSCIATKVQQLLAKVNLACAITTTMITIYHHINRVLVFYWFHGKLGA